MSRLLLSLTVAALLLGTVACEDSNTAPTASKTASGVTRTAETGSPATAAPKASPVASSVTELRESIASARCQAASPALLEAIQAGLPTIQLEGGWVVKSDDFSSAYFIASRTDDGSAVWVSNRDDGTGLIYSVNTEAEQISDWGSGSSTDARFSMSDDGAVEALDCSTH